MSELKSDINRLSPEEISRRIEIQVAAAAELEEADKIQAAAAHWDRIDKLIKAQYPGTTMAHIGKLLEADGKLGERATAWADEEKLQASIAKAKAALAREVERSTGRPPSVTEPHEPARLNDSNHLTFVGTLELEAYQPPNALERIGSLASAALGLAASTLKIPEGLTFSEVVNTAVGNALNGAGQEENVIAQESIEEQTALSFLRGDYQPPPPETESDFLRRQAFLDGVEEYGLEHVLGVKSLFSWLNKP